MGFASHGLAPEGATGTGGADGAGLGRLHQRRLVMGTRRWGHDTEGAQRAAAEGARTAWCAETHHGDFGNGPAVSYYFSALLLEFLLPGQGVNRTRSPAGTSAVTAPRYSRSTTGALVMVYARCPSRSAPRSRGAVSCRWSPWLRFRNGPRQRAEFPPAKPWQMRCWTSVALPGQPESAPDYFSGEGAVTWGLPRGFPASRRAPLRVFSTIYPGRAALKREHK